MWKVLKNTFAMLMMVALYVVVFAVVCMSAHILNNYGHPGLGGLVVVSGMFFGNMLVYRLFEKYE